MLCFRRFRSGRYQIDRSIYKSVWNGRRNSSTQGMSHVILTPFEATSSCCFRGNWKCLFWASWAWSLISDVRSPNLLRQSNHIEECYTGLSCPACGRFITVGNQLVWDDNWDNWQGPWMCIMKQSSSAHQPTTTSSVLIIVFSWLISDSVSEQVPTQPRLYSHL